MFFFYFINNEIQERLIIVNGRMSGWEKSSVTRETRISPSNFRYRSIDSRANSPVGRYASRTSWKLLHIRIVPGAHCRYQRANGHIYIQLNIPSTYTDIFMLRAFSWYCNRSLLQYDPLDTHNHHHHSSWSDFTFVFAETNLYGKAPCRLLPIEAQHFCR